MVGAVDVVAVVDGGVAAAASVVARSCRRCLRASSNFLALSGTLIQSLSSWGSFLFRSTATRSRSRACSAPWSYLWPNRAQLLPHLTATACTVVFQRLETKV